MADILSGAPAPFLPAAGEPQVPWARWYEMFTVYLEAVGGDEFPPARQRAVLLTCLGIEGHRVYTTLPANVKREGETELDFAARRLKEFFEPKRNVCAERYRFRCRGQQPGETVAQWVSVLRQLATHCDYGAMTEDFVRDQVVEKALSSRLRQRLLTEPELTLDKVLTLAETLESAEREAREMEHPAAPGQGPALPVQAVQRRRQDGGPGGPPGGSSGPRLQQQQQKRQQAGAPQQRWRQAGPPPQRRQQAGSTVGRCWGCGRVGHRRGDPVCPAKGIKCRKCGGVDHFGQHCKQSRVV